jgi:integrase
MPYYNKQNPKKPWMGQLWREGKVWKRKSFLTKKEAVQWEVEEGKRLLSLTNTVSLGEWAIRYLDEIERTKVHSTYDEKRRAFQKLFANPGIDKDLPLDALTPALIKDHLRSQVDERSGNAANKDLKNLKAAYKWATLFLGADPSKNPFVIIEKSQEERNPRYVPPLEDFWKVYDICKGQDARMLLCYFHTAARKQELFRLEWLRDVDFFGRKIQLWSRKNRKGQLEGRWIDMTDEVFQLLKEQHKETGKMQFVFVDPENGRQYLWRVHWMNTICKRAEVKPFGLHAIRHLSASVMADSGVPIVAIQHALRHAAATTTDRYIARLKKSGREAVRVLPGPETRILGNHSKTHSQESGLERQLSSK